LIRPHDFICINPLRRLKMTLNETLQVLIETEERLNAILAETNSSISGLEKTQNELARQLQSRLSRLMSVEEKAAGEKARAMIQGQIQDVWDSVAIERESLHKNARERMDALVDEITEWVLGVSLDKP
jgi:hypothetical protein